MPVPLLDYPSLSQNQRGAGYEVPGDEQSWIYTTDDGLDGSEMAEYGGRTGSAITIGGSMLVGGLTLAIALAAWGIISL